MLLPLLLLLPTQTFRIDARHIIRRFDPSTTFGFAIDGHEQGDCLRLLSKVDVADIKGCGLRSLTYRLRTELGDEVWHWNPRGTWSDRAHRQGYWTSSADPTKKILLSYGYRLPRRGNSLDQANRDDYSRIDDGDKATFWKSNPYLDPAYTGIPYRESPQTVVVAFPRPTPLNEVRIGWGTPFATRFRLDFSSSADSDPAWTPLIQGVIVGHAGTQRVRFPEASVRFVRLSLLAGSNTSDRHDPDRRDRLGFAICELQAGMLHTNGRFKDEVVHAPDNAKQTTIYASSTDPWHRAVDRDPHTEQPGFDLVLERGLTNGLPVLIPTGCLYDTPANVSAEARWLRSRRVPLRGIEIGEEPDGNWADAAQYAALYLQMARAIRKGLPQARLGGPSFQTVRTEYHDFPYSGTAFLTRFLTFLRTRKRLKDYAFVSFEWYPFDDVKSDPAGLLPTARPLLRSVVKRLNRLGMKGRSWMVTEYGYSAYAAEAEDTPPGAVFDFDVAMTAVELGAESAYLYGAEPGSPIQEYPGVWGNNMILEELEDRIVRLPTFYAAQLLTRRLTPRAGIQTLLAVSGENDQVGAYAVRGPDNVVRVAFANRTPMERVASLAGVKDRLVGWSYGQPNFVWHAAGDAGRPSLSLPPSPVAFRSGAIRIPPYGIVVLSPAA